jgi:hypothetical protein
MCSSVDGLLAFQHHSHNTILTHLFLSTSLCLSLPLACPSIHVSMSVHLYQPISLFLHFTPSIKLCVFFLNLSLSPFHSLYHTLCIFSPSLCFYISHFQLHSVYFFSVSLSFSICVFFHLLASLFSISSFPFSLSVCLFMSLLLHFSVSPFLCVFFLYLCIFILHFCVFPLLFPFISLSLHF